MEDVYQNGEAGRTGTRNRLLIGLVTGWISAIAAIICGSYCLHLEVTSANGEGAHFLLPRPLKWIIL